MRFIEGFSASRSPRLGKTEAPCARCSTAHSSASARIRRRRARRVPQGPPYDDDRLVGMLSALRTRADGAGRRQQLRTRLETPGRPRAAWWLVWRMRRPVLVIATAALLLGSAATTISAPPATARSTRFGDDRGPRCPRLRRSGGPRRVLLSLLEATARPARWKRPHALAAGTVREIERATLPWCRRIAGHAGSGPPARRSRGVDSHHRVRAGATVHPADAGTARERQRRLADPGADRDAEAVTHS